MRSTQRFLSLFRRFHRTRDVMDPVLPLQRVRRLHQRGTRQPTRRVLRPQRSLLPSLAVADGERGVEIRPRVPVRATAPSASARKLARALFDEPLTNDAAAEFELSAERGGAYSSFWGTP